MRIDNKVEQHHDAQSAERTGRGTPAAVYLAVVGLLGWYFLSTVAASAGKSTMFDELHHLTGGYTYWELGDFRMQPENGNLPQRWDAIPLLFRDTKPPDFDREVWRKCATPNVGFEFFYNSGNDVGAMLLCGRGMNALFGVALGALIFFAARSYFGVGGALVSLTLFAFCPTMLANGAMITSDMAAGLFFFATMLCLWRALQVISWRTVMVSGLVMGGLFVAKFAAFMVIPMGLLLAAVQVVSRRPTIVSWRDDTRQIQGRGSKVLASLGLICAHGVIVWVVIWAFYNFRYNMFAETATRFTEHGGQIVVDEPLAPWSEILGGSGIVERFVRSAQRWHFLPEAYLYGFAFTAHFAKARAAFLNGMVGSTGWPTFFPYCFLVKTPPTLFVLGVLSAFWIVREWLSASDWRLRRQAIGDSLYRAAPLWVLFIVYWAFAITSHLNIGHRHILPTYPVVLVFCGGAWYWAARRTNSSATGEVQTAAHAGLLARLSTWLATRRWPAVSWLVLLCIGGFAGESICSWPNYVSYFNQIVGKYHAYRHLVDSSLDWGQDLPALKKWLFDVGLDGSVESPTYLSYFGTGSPAYYGITANHLPCFFEWDPAKVPEPLRPGTYCISATMLQSVYSDFPGHWTKKYEATYRELKQQVDAFVSGDSTTRSQLVATAGEPYWYQVFIAYEQARFSRLTSYLREREPQFEINNSILIFNLSDRDLNQALEAPLPEMETSR